MTSNSSSSDVPEQSTWPLDLPLPSGSGRYPRLKLDAAKMAPWSDLAEVALGSKTLIIPPGLTLVVGRTGAGKTRTVQALVRASAGQLVYVNLLEPFNQLSEIQDHQVTFSLDEALEQSSLLLADGYVPVIDSFRILTYTSTGATGKRGINMGMFGYMTALNNRLAQENCSMIALINPLLDEADDYAAFIDNCRSAVVGVIEIREPGKMMAQQRPYREKVNNFVVPLDAPEVATSSQQPGHSVVHVDRDFPVSPVARATRNRVRQMQADTTGRLVKGHVNILN